MENENSFLSVSVIYKEHSNLLEIYYWRLQYFINWYFHLLRKSRISSANLSSCFLQKTCLTNYLEIMGTLFKMEVVTKKISNLDQYCRVENNINYCKNLQKYPGNIWFHDVFLKINRGIFNVSNSCWMNRINFKKTNLV